MECNLDPYPSGKEETRKFVDKGGKTLKVIGEPSVRHIEGDQSHV